MIRDDWILRLVQELAEAIARRLEGEAAEIDDLVQHARSQTSLTPDVAEGAPLVAVQAILGHDPERLLTMALVLAAEHRDPVRVIALIDAAVEGDPSLLTPEVRAIRAGYVSLL